MISTGGLEQDHTVSSIHTSTSNSSIIRSKWYSQCSHCSPHKLNCHNHADPSSRDRSSSSCLHSCSLDRSSSTCLDPCNLERSSSACLDSCNLERSSSTSLESCNPERSSSSCLDSPDPPNKTVGRDTSMSNCWSGSGLNYTVQGEYKKQESSQHKEIEDSSSVVSSTQDIELPSNTRYPGPGDITRSYCDEPHRVRQDHFGSLIGMLSELQDANCPEIEQILAEGAYTEIKTEHSPESIHIHQQLNHQTDLGYFSHQDLYPLRQTCVSGESGSSGYRYSLRDDGGGGGGGGGQQTVQYPTQLPLKSGSAPPPITESKGGGSPYSPLSPGSPSIKQERSRDDKYWERRRKNNLAAKKSRDARRVRENQLRLRVLCSENQIRVLRSQLERSQEENQLLRERLKKYEGDVHISSMADDYSLAHCEEPEFDAANGETDFSLAGNSNPRPGSKLVEENVHKT